MSYTALVYGGSGSLGGTYCNLLKEQGFKVYCVDLIESSVADVSCAISGTNPKEDLKKVLSTIDNECVSTLFVFIFKLICL